jgi:hypothetical protein
MHLGIDAERASSVSSTTQNEQENPSLRWRVPEMISPLSERPGVGLDLDCNLRIGCPQARGYGLLV